MRILVTAGGTEEPIDGVRRLTNTSTGATGAVLAHHLFERGAEVLLLHGERARVGDTEMEGQSFLSYSDLESALQHHLSTELWDAVIHLAAVSDYRVAGVEVDGRAVPPGDDGKIGTGREVLLRLKPTPKLIDRLKTWSCNPALRVVGFKLTVGADPPARRRAVEALFARNTVDLVIHNDAREIGPGRHEATFWTAEGPLVHTTTKAEMADRLGHWLEIPSEEHHATLS